MSSSSGITSIQKPAYLLRRLLSVQQAVCHLRHAHGHQSTHRMAVVSNMAKHTWSTAHSTEHCIAGCSRGRSLQQVLASPYAGWLLGPRRTRTGPHKARAADWRVRRHQRNLGCWEIISLTTHNFNINYNEKNVSQHAMVVQCHTHKLHHPRSLPLQAMAIVNGPSLCTPGRNERQQALCTGACGGLRVRQGQRCSSN